MNAFRPALCALALACAMAACAWRTPSAPAGEWVEAEGWSPYDPARLLESRQRALAEAQKKAVEKVSGVALSASTRVEASIASEQSIQAHVGGNIRKYRVLSEKIDQGFLRIRIRALVASAGAQGYEFIAEEVSRNAPELRRGRIAVLPFPYIDGRSSDGPKAVQENLITRLVALGKVQVISRGTRAAEQLALGQGGVLDGISASQLSRTLDVDAVLTGSLLELPGGTVQVLARLTRIPDGLIIAAVEGSVPRHWKGLAEEERPGWLAGLFNPAASVFHSEEEIGSLFREGMNSLKARHAVPAASDGAFKAAAPSSEPPADELKGRWIYERNCRHCHGLEGRGSQAMALALGISRQRLHLGRRRVEESSPQELLSALKAGKGKMPAQAGRFDQAELEALLFYLKGLPGSL